MSAALHIWVSIHHLIVFFVAKVWNDDISKCFFHFFRILVFWSVRGDGVVKGKKWPKMKKKKNLSHSVSKELYLIAGFGTHVLNDDISSVFLFYFYFYKNSDFLAFSNFINKFQKKKKDSHVCPHLLHMCGIFVIHYDLIYEPFDS